MLLALIGVDPGIVDTAAVVLELDTDAKSIRVQPKVWRGVTNRVKQSITVSDTFLKELKTYVANSTEAAKFIYVEGFRPRGRNPQQDQNMTLLVQECHKALKTSTVVDNTGIKNVVIPNILKIFRCTDWDISTHHSDLSSAARVALKGAMQHEVLNGVVADVVRDYLDGEPWREA